MLSFRTTHSSYLPILTLLCVGWHNLPALAQDFSESSSQLPTPLTGRMPHVLYGSGLTPLSQPMATSESLWVNPEQLTLPKSPRVAALPGTAKPKAPPRTAQRSVVKTTPATTDKLEVPTADPDDLAGAFAAPGQPTPKPEIELAPNPAPEITPIDETEEEAKQPESLEPELTEPAKNPLHEAAETSPQTDATERDDEGWQASEEKQTDPPVVEQPLVPPKPLPPLSRNQQFLRTKMRKVLAYYYTKPLNSQQHDCWEAMHGMLAYELHSKIRDGGPRAEPITAIGHLCYNRACKRQQMLRINKDGEIDVRVGVGVQGHKGQFLAMLAQCNVTPDYPMLIDGKQLTIRDLIRSEQRDCQAKTELTFKLIGLMHYLPSDATWVDNRGESWDIPRLIREELAQPIRGAACGGTHRLSGLTLAARKRVARGEPLDGDWLKASQFVEKYQNYAYRLQNRDGSLSTEWFRGPGYEDDIDRRVKTTGHLLEWLLYAASEEQLHAPGTVRAVTYLTNLLYSESTHEWEVGPLSHALHALVIYDKRVYQPYDNQPEEPTVKSTPRNSRPSARRPASSRSR